MACSHLLSKVKVFALMNLKELSPECVASRHRKLISLFSGKDLQKKKKKVTMTHYVEAREDISLRSR